MRKSIKKVIGLVFLTLLVMACGGVHAATLYVAQSSAGTGAGTSFANRASIATHNAGTGEFGTLDDDTVVLCGNIFTSVIVPDGGTTGAHVTYDGACLSTYGESSDAVLSGMDAAGYYSAMYLYIEDDAATVVVYVDIKNITVDQDQTGEMGTALDNDYGLTIRAADNITVDNCTFNENSNGLHLYGSATNVVITNSTLQRAEESGILIFSQDATYYPSEITIGGSLGNGNTFYENTYKTGYDNNMVGYDIRANEYVTGVVVSYNEFSSDTAWRGMSPMLFHSMDDLLIEHNYIHDHGRAAYARPLISLKAETSSFEIADATIRFNKLINWQPFHGLSDEPYASSAITVSGNYRDIYVYCNYFENIPNALFPNGATWASPTTHSDGIDSTRFFAWGNVATNISGSFAQMDLYSSGTDDVYAYINNNSMYDISNSWSSYTSTGVSGTVITDSTASWGTDDYNTGYDVLVTSGTASGTRVDITDTTSTTLTLASDIYAAGMRSGDTFQIQNKAKSAMRHGWFISDLEIYGEFKNNIIVDCRSDMDKEAAVSLEGGATNFTVENILLFESDSDKPQVDYQGSGTCEPCDYDSINNPDNGEYTLASADPFVNSATKDFSINSSSDAYETGDTLTGPSSIPAAVTARSGSFSYANIFASSADFTTTPYGWADTTQSGSWHMGAVDAVADVGPTINKTTGAIFNTTVGSDFN